MKHLRDIFHKEIGMQLPDIPANVQKIIPFSEPDEKCLLFGSEVAIDEPFLFLNYDKFIVTPEGYFLIGFWGHGVNSYAFYYGHIDQNKKIYLRLPYGGVYMDSEEYGKKVRKFLSAFIPFSNKVISDSGKILAIDSMGEALYTIEFADGRKFESDKSYFRNPNFEEILR